MRGEHDEELVFHVRKGLVVHDLFEEALFSDLGQFLEDDMGPSFERDGEKDVREEIRALVRFPSHGSNGRLEECTVVERVYR
jgi:hypothetical protein